MPDTGAHRHEPNHESENENDRNDRNDRNDDHLEDLPPGAGCTEIWTHLAERREK